MENYILLSKKSPLFDGISEEDIQKLYNCLNVRKRKIEKDSFVFRAGEEACSVYLILSGSMHIIDEDFWGNRSIIETMEAYTLFGEAYNLASMKKYLVGVIASETSIVLEMDSIRLFEICSIGCSCHGRLIKNVALILSEKIVRLTAKVGHIAQRTMREKILSYLSRCATQAQSNSFYIPYSRQQLADYLCVERSSLSHELSKLKDLGMIRYRKSHFELLDYK